VQSQDQANTVPACAKAMPWMKAETASKKSDETNARAQNADSQRKECHALGYHDALPQFDD
jgi:hypothetical protein